MTQLAVVPEPSVEHHTLHGFLSAFHPTAARHAHPTPYQLQDVVEGDIATLSRRLAAIKTYLIPTAHRELESHHHGALDMLMGHIRETEHHLRCVQSRLHGEVHHAGTELHIHQKNLATSEQLMSAATLTIAGHLDRTLDSDHQLKLTTLMRDANRRGPTRPHPHSPERLGLRRIGFRVSAAVDHALDAMDSRVVPAA